MSVMTFTVPGPPVAKARARTVVNRGKVHSFTPDKTARYENLVRLAFRESYPDHVPVEGAIFVSIAAYFEPAKCFRFPKGWQPDLESMRHTKRPDADNLGKICADGLNGVAWRDDAQIADLTVRKRYSLTPRVEITIQQIEPGAPAENKSER